jgi:hypothetical protein
MDAEVAPVFQEYVLAPLAVMVAELPAQIPTGALMNTDKALPIVTLAVLMLLQLLLFVPMTLYVVFTLGLTTIELVVAPLFQA